MNPGGKKEGQPGHLPRPLTAFVGRERELADLAERLADPGCRLLTLTGPGGIGKTRLALAAAEAQRAHFPDGVFFVNLQHVYDPAVLISTIAESTRVTLAGAENPLDQLCDRLTGRRLLLVLDNFEQLLENTGIILALLEKTAASLLTTSREPLNLQEEWLYPVHGLIFENDNASAIQLFTDRALRVQPHFDPAADLAHIQQICTLVEGMPLAIELAAAWTRSLSAAEILAEIQDNLEFLTTRHRNIPIRHRSIETIFEQTWQQMSTKEQQVFARLSVFRGGFQREAAEDIAGASLAILSDLIDKSLIRWEQTFAKTGPPGRYQIHELLRQFAAGRLAADPAAEQQTLDHFRAFFTRYMANRFDELLGGRQAQMMAEIGAELENIRAAWRISLAAHQPETLEALAAPLMSFFWYDDRFQEAEDLFKKAIDQLETWSKCGQRDLILGVLYTNLAWINLPRGDLEFTIGLAQKAQHFYASSGRPPVHGLDTDPNLVLGCANFYLNDLDRALYQIQQALDTASEHNHRLNLQMAHRLLGTIYARFEKFDLAVHHGQEGLKISEMLNDRWGISYAHDILGDIAIAMQAYDQAEFHYEESFKIRERFNFQMGLADALQKLGFLALMRRKPVAARDYLSRSMELFAKTRMTIGDIASRLGVARAELLVKDAAAAYVHLQYVAHKANEHLTQHQAVMLDYLLSGGSYLILCGRPNDAYPLLAAAYAHPEAFDVQKEFIESFVPVEKLPQPDHRPLEDHVDYLKTLILSAEPPEVSAAAGVHQPLLDPLTPRELEVLQLLAEGHTNKQIAGTLFLSVGTVKSYTSHIYSKLGVSHRTQAIVKARQFGLVT